MPWEQRPSSPEKGLARGRRKILGILREDPTAKVEGVRVEGRALLAQDLWLPPTVSVAFISAICHLSVGRVWRH